METPSFNFFTVEALTFKSYYVVWKLFSPVKTYSSTFEFKSYYVVWKPRPDQFLAFPEGV